MRFWFAVIKLNVNLMEFILIVIIICVSVSLSTLPPIVSANCTPDNFRCNNGRCIPKRWVCGKNETNISY